MLQSKLIIGDNTGISSKESINMTSLIASSMLLQDSCKVLTIEILTLSIARFPGVLILRDLNSLAFKTKSSYFSVDHAKPFLEDFAINNIKVFLLAFNNM